MRFSERIKRVRSAIYAGGAINTPLLELASKPAKPVGSFIFLKLENLQPFVRCYKLRGALHALSVHGDAADGIVTASAGNFAQRLAYACRKKNVPFYVIVPKSASRVKLERIAAIYPQVQVIRVEASAWWQCMLSASANRPGLPQAFRRASFISPATNVDVIDANATIGLELLEAQAIVDAQELQIIVPYGGGGLITGIAKMIREHFRGQAAPVVKIFACEIDVAAPLEASLAAGKPVDIDYTPSFVDGIGAPSVLPEAFATVRGLIDGSLTVNLQETADAVLIYCIPAAWSQRGRGLRRWRPGSSMDVLACARPASYRVEMSPWKRCCTILPRTAAQNRR